MKPDARTLAMIAAAALLSAYASQAAEPAPAAPKATEAAPAKADPSSPVGRWKTVDDSTGKAKSVVEIWEENSKLYGKIAKLLDTTPADPDPKCDKYKNKLKNARITGMRMLWDLKKSGDEWSGGKILDPENGKSYKCYLAVVEGGKKLKIRGYIGFALLGRTQYWSREP